MDPVIKRFDMQTLAIPGKPVEQARYLLRRVAPLGNVSQTLTDLPTFLDDALQGKLTNPKLLASALEAHVAGLNLDFRTELSGDLSTPLSNAHGKTALYFVIHDTSSPSYPYKSTFPKNIDTAAWKYNALAPYLTGDGPFGHLYVNRLGQSLSKYDFGVANGATKLETTSKGLGSALVGRFLHTELVQPRIDDKMGIDEFAPDPGFTAAQLERLALLYFCAGARRGDWLIPAYHCVLDETIKNGHDDPQNFDLAAWGAALQSLYDTLAGAQPAAVAVAAAPAAAPLALVMALATPPTTPPAAYTPPPASLPLLGGVPWSDAARVGDHYKARFDRWDAMKEGRTDPSLCPGLFDFPGGVLFWESKMALDADGATTPSVLASSSGSQEDTSLMFATDVPVDAEVVPYFVVPARDLPKYAKPGKPWEGSDDSFMDDFRLKLGMLGVVIFENKITGAILADEGPAMKIGEASIRVHELIRHPGKPWKGNPAKKKLEDASEEKNVLYFVFRDTVIDIDKYDSSDQTTLAADIQRLALKRFDAFRGV